MFEKASLSGNMSQTVPQGVPGTLIPNCMGSCHGQILIETATHSFNLKQKGEQLVCSLGQCKAWPFYYQ